jgi:hypothetical protein
MLLRGMAPALLEVCDFADLFILIDQSRKNRMVSSTALRHFQMAGYWSHEDRQTARIRTAFIISILPPDNLN